MQPYTRQTAYCGRNGDYAIDEKTDLLAYSHGFNIVEEGMQIRKDITVIMCAQNVRDQFVRNIKEGLCQHNSGSP
jgi:hypothetical protein